MKKPTLVLFSFILFLAFMGNGIACSIAGDPPTNTPWKNDYDRATLVFIGEFQEAKRIDTMPPEPPGFISNMYSYDVEVTFKVAKSYKGMFRKGDLIKIRTEIGGLCNFGINTWQQEKSGASWLVYANLWVPDEKTGVLRLSSSSLSPTSPIAEIGKENLQFLEDLRADMQKRMFLFD